MGAEPTQHKMERLLGFGKCGIVYGQLENALKAAILSATILFGLQETVREKNPNSSSRNRGHK